jgi:hypothetical protein
LSPDDSGTDPDFVGPPAMSATEQAGYGDHSYENARQPDGLIQRQEQAREEFNQ